MNFMSLFRTKICLTNHRTMLTGRTIFTERCRRRASNFLAVRCKKHPGAPAYSVGSYRCILSGLSFRECCEFKSTEKVVNVVHVLRQTNVSCNCETSDARSIQSKYENYNCRIRSNVTTTPENVEFSVSEKKTRSCLSCVKCKVKEKQIKDLSHCKKELHTCVYTYHNENEKAHSSLTQGWLKSRAYAVNSNSKFPFDGQVRFLFPGGFRDRYVSSGANLMIARKFIVHSGQLANDHNKNGSENDVSKEENHEEEIEDEWIHPDNRSDTILDKDPELKSLLRELATDFGKDKPLDDLVKGTNGSDQADKAENEMEGIMKGDVKVQTFDFQGGGDETLDPIRNEKAEQDEKKFVFSIDDLVSILREENAQDTCVINIPKEKQYVDYFVVVTGRSPRHLKAMALHINQQYKSKKTKKDPFVLIEGEDTDDWICIDFGNIVLHLMSEETREFYELEKLWTLGPEFDDQLKRIKDHEMKMKETLDSVDVNKENIEGEDDSGNGKPVISFAR